MGLGARHGEIPAASAGMTDLVCAGVTEAVLRGCGGGGVARVWRRRCGAGVADLVCAGVVDLVCAGVADL